MMMMMMMMMMLGCATATMPPPPRQRIATAIAPPPPPPPPRSSVSLPASTSTSAPSASAAAAAAAASASVSASAGSALLMATMYSDAQCPCSAQFVADMKHILDHPDFQELLDFRQFFEPACNDAVSHCPKPFNDSQLFKCIHGPEECLGHRYFLCAQHLAVAAAAAGAPDSPPTYRTSHVWLDFQSCSYGQCMLCDVFTELACLQPCATYNNFTDPSGNDIMRNCAYAGGIDWATLQACADPSSALGQSLQSASARQCVQDNATYGTRGLPVVTVGAHRVTTTQAVPLVCGPTPLEVLGAICMALGEERNVTPPSCANTSTMCSAIANSSRLPECKAAHHPTFGHP